MRYGVVGREANVKIRALSGGMGTQSLVWLNESLILAQPDGCWKLISFTVSHL